MAFSPFRSVSTNTYHLLRAEKGLVDNVHDKIKNESCVVKIPHLFLRFIFSPESGIFLTHRADNEMLICNPTTKATQIHSENFSGSSPLAKENDVMYNAYGI